jgi:hypothetical protein
MGGGSALLGGRHCVPCRTANSRYSSEWAAAQRAGDWRGFVPTTLVLGHIQKLRKAGIGYRAIAAAADIAKSIAMILNGERLQIRKLHADRILAVDRTAMADRALVRAGRTARHLPFLVHEVLPSFGLSTALLLRVDWGRDVL